MPNCFNASVVKQSNTTFLSHFPVCCGESNWERKETHRMMRDTFPYLLRRVELILASCFVRYRFFQLCFGMSYLNYLMIFMLLWHIFILYKNNCACFIFRHGLVKSCTIHILASIQDEHFTRNRHH